MRWLIIVCFVLVGLSLFCSYYELKECGAKGGKMVKTGETTYYVKTGSILMPISSDDYQCDK